MIYKFNRLNSFFILLLLVGYILISFLPGVMGTNSRMVTIPYRGLVLCLSLYILIQGIIWKRHKTFPSREWGFFIAFWVIYLFRVVYDLYYVGIKATVFPNTSDYILNAVGICLLPCVAIRYADSVDFKWVLKWFFRLLLVALSLSLFLNLVSPISDEVEYAGRYKGSSAMNSITYGHYGVSFALVSMFLFTKSEFFYKKAFYTLCFFFGLFIMYLAGSRSPLVALLVCSFFFQINNTGLFKGLVVVVLLAMPLYIFSDQIIEFLSGFGGSFIGRVLATINGGHTSGRDVLYVQALRDFADSPILGNAFLLQQGSGIGFYPHNIIIEAFMATGVVGGIVFIIWVARCLIVSYKLVASSHQHAWTGVLFLQYLIYGMFSLAIFSNAGFWYYSILVWNVAYTTYKREQAEAVGASQRKLVIQY